MTKLPKIIGDVWFNTGTLTPEDLKGKIVLVDFWTYSCVNCQRTLPYLRDWWKKYKSRDFILIGVHSPEFEFEKDPKNVEKALKDLGVEWPVVLDNEHINWDNFENHYWPAKYLSNKNGEIVYTHFGEGNYAETEKEIQKLLGEISEEKMPEVVKSGHEHGNVCFIPTPETYCGYERGRIANAGGYQYDQIFNYKAPEKLPDDSIALSGKFLVRPEYAQSQETGATLLLHFRATEINLVLGPADKNAVIELKLDDKSIPKDIIGKHVSDMGDVIIEKATMYNFLKSNSLKEGILKVIAKSGDFRAYAFTFSGCKQ